MEQSNSVWAVIPAYNEGKNILQVLSRTKEYCRNIIVVDDGSSDDTFARASNASVVVLRHIVNIGKGAALKTGCDYACKNGASVIIVLDADAQHDPAEIPNFLNAIKGHDIVFGSRSLASRMPAVLRFGNKVISSACKLLFGVKIIDTQSGYRCFTADAYKKIRWHANDYSMESEMIVNVGKHKLKYAEVRIKTIYSDTYKGTTVLDGVKIVLNMLWWKIFRR